LKALSLWEELKFNLRDNKRKSKKRRKKTETEFEMPKPKPFDDKGVTAPLSSDLLCSFSSHAFVDIDKWSES